MRDIVHHSGQHGWLVDREAAAATMAWIQRAPAAWQADLEGMADYFPHWALVGAADGAPVRCGLCAERAFAAPMDGALRCLACRQPAAATGLAWVGQLPILARPETRFQRRRESLREAGFGEAAAPGLDYLLVPLTVLYPAEWPNVEPAVRYSRRWLQLMGLPSASAAHHLVGAGQACIFAWGQWRAMSIAAVLQQRMVNHLASLCKIVAGQPPGQAFIGRIH
ncbi:MAG TPA: hypothetical protein VD886_20690 [Herpetosiphonaceae bacterium]|nr:hypothetical protein [Herpetosiphonaceae bacterium]